MKYIRMFINILMCGLLCCLFFYGGHRILIERKLKELTYVCPDSLPSKPAFKDVRKEMVTVYEERNELFKHAARTSLTYGEFKRKSDAILLKFEREDKVGKLIKQHKRRAQRK